MISQVSISKKIKSLSKPAGARLFLKKPCNQLKTLHYRWYGISQTVPAFPASLISNH